MTQPDKLTIEEVEERIATADSGGRMLFSMSLYDQLRDVMRENERLQKIAVEACERNVDLMGIIANLQSNKD